MIAKSREKSASIKKRQINNEVPPPTEYYGETEYMTKKQINKKKAIIYEFSRTWFGYSLSKGGSPKSRAIRWPTITEISPSDFSPLTTVNSLSFGSFTRFFRFLVKENARTAVPGMTENSRKKKINRRFSFSRAAHSRLGLKFPTSRLCHVFSKCRYTQNRFTLIGSFELPRFVP